MVLGGRGSGKTRAAAQYVLEHLERLGPTARVGVGGPTAADARDVCAEGVSGLITIGRGRFANYNRSLGEARHVLGGYVKFLGSEQPARWNGPQWTLLWADELALWVEQSWEQAQFGLRLGPHPRSVVSTTPKARLFVKALAEQATTRVRHATTFDNPYLSPIATARLQERYGGTRLGQQELEARWLLDVPGALWTHAMLDGCRRTEHPDLVRVVVGVDPSGGATDDHDEQGIIVAGKGIDGDAYVLADYSCRLSPDGWGRRAAQAYLDNQADKILVEKNFGGDMATATIQTAARMLSTSVNVKAVTASRGKAVRAEPIAALYEQQRVHHVGVPPAELEDQLCNWVPGSHDRSPDRLDALVWALTDLMISGGTTEFY